MRASISVTLETRLAVERVDTRTGTVRIRLLDGTGTHEVKEGDTIVLPLTWRGGTS